MEMWAEASVLVSFLLAPLFGVMVSLEPVWQGVILGLPVAMLALVIYRFASNQAAITTAKTGIKGQLLALRLFRDDLRVVLQAQGKIVLLTARYLRLALLPLAILLIPIVMLIVQAEARFAYAPLEVEQPAVLTVVLAPHASPTETPLRLRTDAGVRVETPPTRLASEQRVMWRIAVTRPGRHELVIEADDGKILRTIWAGDRPELLVPALYRPNDVRSLLNPAERLVDSTTVVSEVFIDYPANGVLVAGLSRGSWAMILASLLFGFALRRPFGVDF
jgi:hypothetical protein